VASLPDSVRIPNHNHNNDHIMPQGKEMFAGLNQNGLIAFIVILVFCFPLAWIPWLIDGCRADPNKPID
jgi:hypothetical protein